MEHGEESHPANTSQIGAASPTGDAYGGLSSLTVTGLSINKIDPTARSPRPEAHPGDGARVRQIQDHFVEIPILV